MENSYKNVIKKLNIYPHNPKLYEQAFTHSSFVHEKKDATKDYERIEFIGDGVLDLVVADLIFKTFPEMPQGDMSKLRAKLVQGVSLANYARELEIGSAIKLGHGEKNNGGNDSNKILEDVFESLIGAIYLDQGFKVIYEIVKDIFEEDIKNFNEDELTDYKSRLQEEIQSDHRGNVVYNVVSEKGSAQDKEFTIEVVYDGIVLGIGKGQNKKKAEQNAAKEALKKRAL